MCTGIGRKAGDADQHQESKKAAEEGPQMALPPTGKPVGFLAKIAMKRIDLKADAPGRLDTFLSRSFPEYTRSYIRKLVLNGDIRLNGQCVKAGAKLKAGDKITGTIPDPQPISAVAQDIALDVLYEDGDIIVVNKPRGMVTHPAPGSPGDTLVNALLYHAGDLSGIGGMLRPGIVHRLDKDTSGVLVAAKNDRAHLELSRQLQEHEMEKHYLALVAGSMRDDTGTIAAPLARSRRDYKKMTVDPAGKPAITHFTVKERFRGYTLLDVRIETGRTHQIRVHMRHIGHPVAGDPVYGPKSDPLHLGGQFLHAARLSFTHPVTGEKMLFEAPLPSDLAEVLDRLDPVSI